MEEKDVAPHVESSQSFRDRVSGKKEGGLLAWPCDLALYALKTDVLIVLLDAQRVTSSTSSEWDAAKSCEELWFDQAVEAEKKRVVCIVMDKEHFELAVVRTPVMRFVFDLGADWVEARRLILAFVKKRVPGAPLGPKWEPPAGSLLALKIGRCAGVSESDARAIEAMESKTLLAQPLVQVESERELSSTHTHVFSLSPHSFCRYKTAPPRTPSVSSFPNQVKPNLSTSVTAQSSSNKLVQSSISKSVHSNASVERRSRETKIESDASVERSRETKIERDASQLPANKCGNNASKSGVVESGKIFYSDERGGGERGEGPKHSLMNTPHIDYHRFGANKSKAQAQHEVFPGSAKDGIAQQGMSQRPFSPAKDRQGPTVKPAKSLGARHYKSNRGEKSKTYISSLSSNGYEYNSSPPHSTPSMVSRVFYVPGT